MKRAVVILLLSPLNYLTSAQAQFWERLEGTYGGAARAIAVSPNNHLFAGMEGANGVDVYRSTNSGTTWTATNNYPTSFISSTSLAVNPSGYIFSGDNNGGGMFRSTDDGASWTQINAGLTELSIQALTINKAGHVFVGVQYGGVFRSTDAGAWSSGHLGHLPRPP